MIFNSYVSLPEGILHGFSVIFKAWDYQTGPPRFILTQGSNDSNDFTQAASNSDLTIICWLLDGVISSFGLISCNYHKTLLMISGQVVWNLQNTEGPNHQSTSGWTSMWSPGVLGFHQDEDCVMQSHLIHSRFNNQQSLKGWQIDFYHIGDAKKSLH